jgi:hypothetical protein
MTPNLVRAPAEALLARVYAEVSQAEESGPPLNAARAIEEVSGLSCELEDMHFSADYCRDDLRAKAIDVAIAAIRYVRDVCGGENA